MLGPAASRASTPPTIRRFRNTSDTEEAVYLCVGGAGGYVGRDGRTVGDDPPPLDARRGRRARACSVKPRRP